MKLGDIIRATKANVEIGGWNNGKIPASAFKIRRKFPSGSDWDWRIITFEALSRNFRVLLRLNLDKSYYSAILSLENGSVIQIICHHEIHISHRNWHCHFVPGDVTTTFPNVLRDKDRIRLFEQAPSQANEVNFDMNRAKALTHALNRYRIKPPAVNEAQSEFVL